MGSQLLEETEGERGRRARGGTVVGDPDGAGRKREGRYSNCTVVVERGGMLPLLLPPISALRSEAAKRIARVRGLLCSFSLKFQLNIMSSHCTVCRYHYYAEVTVMSESSPYNEWHGSLAFRFLLLFFPFPLAVSLLLP